MSTHGYRDASIYVSFKTLRRLRWVAKAIAVQSSAGTADELADLLLNKILIERYPTLLDYEKTVAKHEEEFAATLLPAGTSVSNGSESVTASFSQN